MLPLLSIEEYMARVAWSFNSQNFAINPDEDSGWTAAESFAENLPIGATQSSMQWGGRKSGRRTVSGWLWGPETAAQKTMMQGWKNNRTIANLIDHTGESVKAMVINFNAKPVLSQSEWKQGRQTYRYEIEFVTRP